MKTKKQLRIWNGRGHGKKYDRGSFYVAAYSVAEAARLIAQAAGSHNSGFEHEIKTYYSKDCWGKPMEGITPTEPCVYATTSHYNEKPKRII